MWFASAAEAKRYRQLKELEGTGAIDRLTLQLSLPCVVHNHKICTYRADFSYDVIDDRGSTVRTVVEDVKGMITDVYRIKKKLVEAVHGIRIVEIPAKEIPSWSNRIPE